MYVCIFIDHNKIYENKIQINQNQSTKQINQNLKTYASNNTSHINLKLKRKFKKFKIFQIWAIQFSRL